jgi:hypothetical protein
VRRWSRMAIGAGVRGSFQNGDILGSIIVGERKLGESHRRAVSRGNSYPVQGSGRRGLNRTGFVGGSNS